MTPTLSDTLVPLPCIDRLTAVEPGRSARATRRVDPSEEYFIDHFSGFAVLPGVLQLEGLVQTASWLIRATEGFERSQVRMTACSQAKYTQLVRPGMTIGFDVEVASSAPHTFDVRGKVTEGEKTVASARFRLESSTISESNPRFSHLEPLINEKNRQIFQKLKS
jgi:3-hydroxyacyl-[acyl-carrier-protein] dehydratase